MTMQAPGSTDLGSTGWLLDALAALIDGVAIVCGPGGGVLAHCAATRHRPGDRVVEAVLRRDATDLLEHPGPDVSIRRDHGSATVLLTGARDLTSSAVDDLVRQVVAAFAVGADAATPGAALLRLVNGRPAGGDADLLGLPVAGARLLVARSVAAARLTGALERDRGVLVTRRDDAVVVLARDVPRRAGDDRGLRSAVRVASACVRADTGCRVGISAALTSLADLPRAYADAADAALLASASSPYVLVDEMWATITATRLRRHLAVSSTVGNPLSALAGHDARTGSDLARTLGAWLADNQDTVMAAGRLNLHPNTLRYRLRRLGQLVGLDLADADTRLVAQIALSGSVSQGVG